MSQGLLLRVRVLLLLARGCSSGQRRLLSAIGCNYLSKAAIVSGLFVRR